MDGTKVSKREIWETIKADKDTFKRHLVETFGAQRIEVKGKVWEKEKKY